MASNQSCLLFKVKKLLCKFMEMMRRRNIPELPVELVEMIIIKSQPVVAGKCKLLSKYWNDIISSNTFVAIHKSEMKSQNSVGLVLQRETTFQPLQYMTTEFPPGYRRLFYLRMKEYLACVNSFILLCNNDDRLLIINPITRASLLIPHETINFPLQTMGCSCFFGLCFDQGSKVFSVLRLSIFHGWEVRSEVKMYSSQTNAWVLLPPFPYERPVSSPGAFVNGSFHWILYSERIAAFNVSTQNWSIIDLPLALNPSEKIQLISAFVDHTLVLYQWVYEPGEPNDIWVLDDYPNPSSWRRISIIFPDAIETPNVITFQPLFMMEPEKDKIMFRCNPLGWFGYWDIVRGIWIWTSRNLFPRQSCTVFPYAQSLEDPANL